MTPVCSGYTGATETKFENKDARLAQEWLVSTVRCVRDDNRYTC